MLALKSTRLSQGGAREIDFARYGNATVFNPALSNFALPSGCTIDPDPSGLVATFPDSAVRNIQLNDNINGLTGFTYFVVYQPSSTAPGGDRGIFGNRNNTGTTTFLQFVHRAGTGAEFLTTLRLAGQGETLLRSPLSSATLGDTHILVATVGRSAFRFYLNGVLQQSANISFTAITGMLSSRIGNYFDNSTGRQIQGAIKFAAVIPTELSEREVVRLTANPWQIYR
jgi:hypothetical protein